MIREVPESPQAIETIAIDVGCMPEVVPIVKISHTLVARHGETKLILKWKLPSCWLVFTVYEEAMQATGGELSPIVLLGYGP